MSLCKILNCLLKMPAASPTCLTINLEHCPAHRVMHSTPTTILASNEIKSLRVIPNPNNGVFTVSYQLPQNKEGMLTITNQLGDVIYKEKRPQWLSICNINVSKLPQGVYLVTIESNGKRKNVKFVKQ